LSGLRSHGLSGPGLGESLADVAQFSVQSSQGIAEEDDLPDRKARQSTHHGRKQLRTIAGEIRTEYDADDG
jgi:hypothetical protein